ncbi:FHA domain-containing protein [uncultured Acinetobacter sp.]|uniref:FHA domain-containing protein n=1 Tax=uncultured Acinetobacter sp. TaxID=165433 RepID=UPI0025D1CF92|nr:FHA domain-containing protein [uncultured Acinetobacter sp.]
MTWKLQAITGEFDGQEVAIERDMLIGRHQDADLVLQSAEISRRHAAFLLKDDALWVQDLKSSNGTFVNDIRIEHDKLLKDGDIVQFASIKFNVLAPAKVESVIEKSVPEIEIEPVSQAVEKPVQQPSEAIATAEIKEVELQEKVIEEKVEEKTAAQQMNEQGMPELASRDSSVQLSRDGMPTAVGIPKPAPIPEGVDLQAQVEAAPAEVSKAPSTVDQQLEEKKNTSVGLISIVTLVILAIIAWLFFK